MMGSDPLRPEAGFAGREARTAMTRRVPEGARGGTMGFLTRT